MVQTQRYKRDTVEVKSPFYLSVTYSVFRLGGNYSYLIHIYPSR